MKHSLLALGLTTLPLLALAEDNTVVVTASRYEQPITNTLAAVTVLTKEDIERYGDNELADLLSRIAGITQTPTGSLGSTDSLQIRGASTGQMIVLVDGIQAGSASLGQANLENLSLANIERIEIIRGPVSSLYGAGGIGGVIQVFTKDPQRSEDDLFVSAEYGSFNLQRYTAGFQTQAGSTRASGQISRLTTGGFDSTTLDGINSDDDAFQQWSGSLSVSKQLSDQSSLSLAHSQTSNDIEFDSLCYDNLYNPITCANDIDWHTVTDVMTSQLTYTQDFDRTDLAIQLGRHSDEADTPENDSRFTTQRFSYNVAGQTDWSNQLSTVFGTDGQFESVETNEYADQDRTNLSLFSQVETQLREYRLQVGARLDENSDYGTHLTGNIALATFIVGNIEGIVSTGTAFKAPTFNDLYYPGYGDEDVKPEESETLELAVRQFTDSGYWRVSLYQTKTDNLIAASDASPYLATNINEASMEGVELEWQHNLGQYRFDANASYIEAHDGDDKRLANIPDWSGAGSITRFIGAHSVSLDIKTEEGRVSGSEKMDGYMVAGLGGNYRFGRDKRSELFGRIDNLFDTDYVLNHDSSGYDYNTPGRTFKVGIEYHL